MNLRTKSKAALLTVVSSLFATGSLLAQSTDSPAAPPQPMNPVVATILGVVYLAIIIVMIAALWKIFVKAGRPGWASIIPIYNTYVMVKIAGRSGWWVLLLFIPLVNFIIAIILMVDIAKAFGKGVGFAIGMLLLGIVFFPMLAFGDAKYQAPAAA